MCRKDETLVQLAIVAIVVGVIAILVITYYFNNRNFDSHIKSLKQEASAVQLAINNNQAAAKAFMGSLSADPNITQQSVRIEVSKGENFSSIIAVIRQDGWEMRISEQRLKELAEIVKDPKFSEALK